MWYVTERFAKAGQYGCHYAGMKGVELGTEGGRQVWITQQGLAERVRPGGRVVGVQFQQSDYRRVPPFNELLYAPRHW